jgi:hypothetical protein
VGQFRLLLTGFCRIESIKLLMLQIRVFKVP